MPECLDAQLSQVGVTEFRQQLVAHGVVEKRPAILRQPKLVKKLNYIRHDAPQSDEIIILAIRNHRRRSISVGECGSTAHVKGFGCGPLR
jgi:hypothetical protein